MSTRTRIVQVVAATAAVGLLPVGLTAVHLPTGEAATTTTVAPAAVASGTYTTRWVAISTSGTPSVTVNDASGRVGAAQPLTPAAECAVDQGSASTRYLTLSGRTGRTFTESLASFASGSLGVREKKTGVSCSQVNTPGEALRLALGPGLTSTLGAGAVATSAYLDVELKQSAQILATARRNGVVTGTFELRSGSTVTSPLPLPGGIRATSVATCNNPADSGPDSGVNDNCRWAVSVPSWLGSDDGIAFDELTLEAVNGAFSLEGGSDGTVLPQAPLSTPNASILQVADGLLDCGASTRTISAAGDEPQVSVYRLGNADGSACAVVPYSLDTAPGYAQFLKPLDRQTSAQFLWDLTWRFPQSPGTTALPDLRIDYEYPAPGTEVRLGWCPDPRFDSTGRFAGYTGDLPASLDQEPDLDGTQFACVVSRTARPVDGSPDTVSSRDVVYVYGDAGMRF